MNNTMQKTLEVEVLNIQKGEYLSKALKRQGYPMLPSNAIINKVMTGTGATYMELHPKLSPRNSIVIEPFKSAVENKVQVFNEALGVFKEVNVKQLIAYLKNANIKYKKIITTPEGFLSKVIKAAKDLGINIYKEYFCLFDEAEHITEDTDYRRSISAPMREFFKFEGKALISATPLKPSKHTLTLFLRHKFRWVEIRPDYDYREDMTLITTHSFYCRVKRQVKSLLDNGSPHVCIFYKTTEGICNIVESLLHDEIITKEGYKVFCSKDGFVTPVAEYFRLLHHACVEITLLLVGGFGKNVNTQSFTCDHFHGGVVTVAGIIVQTQRILCTVLDLALAQGYCLAFTHIDDVLMGCTFPEVSPCSR